MSRGSALFLCITIACGLLAGCSSVKTPDIDPVEMARDSVQNAGPGRMHRPLAQKPGTVCIVRNPRVKIGAAIPGLRDAFEKRGIHAVVVERASACPGPWRVHYVMRRSWDFTTYLGTAELSLYKNQTLVSTASYKSGKPTLTKWGRTRERIDSVVGKLLGEK